MRETEIRERVHEVIGPARYPATLKDRVEARLGQPEARIHPTLLGLVAAILAVLIVASLVYIRVQSVQPGGPAAGPSARPTPSPLTLADLPAFDLAAADLTPAAALVSREDLVATSGGRTVRVIGAYAEPARTVLILRTLPETGPPLLNVSDSKGHINAGVGAIRGVVGDWIDSIDQGPYAGSDGVANLNVSITGFLESSPIDGRARGATPIAATSGMWNFGFDLRVQSATKLPLQPNLTSVGSWKVRVEMFELTPSVIHFKAVLDGAPSSDAARTGVSVIDGASTSVQASGWATFAVRTGVTQVDFRWPRPAAAATYQLQIVGGGGRYRTSIAIPDAPPIDYGGKGGKAHPPSPTDFPVAQESLNLQGAMMEHVSTGNPESCGAGFGRSGSIFEFATYFQSNGAWYYMSFHTDSAIEQYQGPGIYKARATLSPVSPPLGATGPMFEGTAQLTVISDSGLHRGSVSGTLGWTDDPNQAVRVSGAWTCMPGRELGPGAAVGFSPTSTTYSD